MADKPKEQQHGGKGASNADEEFVRLILPESLGGDGETETQFPVSEWTVLCEYLLSTGHEYLSTGTEIQQRAIARFQEIMPNVEVSEEAEISG